MKGKQGLLLHNSILDTLQNVAWEKKYVQISMLIKEDLDESS